MASSKLVTLLFAFAMAAAILQPYEARPQVLKPDRADQDGQAPQPSPVVSPGSTPVLPSLPAQPTACLTPLLAMMSCTGYLTNLTVLAPPSTCCDGLKSVIRDAPICLCHGLNGDMNSFMPRPINPFRMMLVPLLCGTMPPLRMIFSCNTLPVPPIMPPAAPVPPKASP